MSKQLTPAESEIIRRHYIKDGIDVTHRLIGKHHARSAIYQYATNVLRLGNQADKEFVMKMGGPWPKLPRAAA